MRFLHIFSVLICIIKYGLSTLPELQSSLHNSKSIRISQIFPVVTFPYYFHSVTPVLRLMANLVLYI